MSLESEAKGFIYSVERTRSTSSSSDEHGLAEAADVHCWSLLCAKREPGPATVDICYVSATHNSKTGPMQGPKLDVGVGGACSILYSHVDIQRITPPIESNKWNPAQVEITRFEHLSSLCLTPALNNINIWSPHPKPLNRKKEDATHWEMKPYHMGVPKTGDPKYSTFPE